MALETGSIVQPMLDAMKNSLGKSWEQAKDFAETEAQKTAYTLANIGSLASEGKITKDQASALLDMQKHATQAVLLALEGIGLIAAQKAINAALGAVATVVNKAIGFTLL